MNKGQDERLMAEIDECHQLNDEEFNLLHRTWKKSENTKIFQDLMKANLRLVRTIARGIAAIGLMTFDDCFQEGATAGLSRAIKKFDPERGVPFGRFAARCIRGSIWRAYFERFRSIPLPIHLAILANKVRKARWSLMASLDRVPTIEEIAEKLEVPVEEIEDAMWISSKHTTSLQGMANDEGEVPFKSTCPNPATAAEKVWALRTIERILERLEDRDRKVASYRIFWRLTSDRTKRLGLLELGRLIGVGKSRVGQLEQRLRDRLPYLYRELGLEGASS